MNQNTNGAVPHFVSSILAINKWVLFIVWMLLNFLVIYLYQHLLFTDDIYYNSYGEKVAMERIQTFLDMKARFWWLSYSFVPIVLLFKTALITLTLNVGTLLGDVKLGFGKLFGIVLTFEGLFIAGNLIRIFWLRYVSEATVMEDVQYFYPLSLLNFFNPETLPSWLIYPVYMLNLFELAYIFLLAIGIRLQTGINFGKSMLLVVSSYGIGLAIWTMLIILLTISLT